MIVNLVEKIHPLMGYRVRNGDKILKMNFVRIGRRTLKEYHMVLLLAQLMIPLCDGSCSGFSPITGLRGCMYEGHFLPLNSMLEIGCTECTCSEFGEMLCCRNYAVLRVPETCIVVYDGCTPRPALRSDPEQPCDGHFYAVG